LLASHFLLCDNIAMKEAPLQSVLAIHGKPAELAAHCGVSQQVVAYWRKIGRVPRKHARRAAEFLNLPLPEVLGVDQA
jgi:hypothetical protein